MVREGCGTSQLLNKKVSLPFFLLRSVDICTLNCHDEYMVLLWGEADSQVLWRLQKVEDIISTHKELAI